MRRIIIIAAFLALLLVACGQRYKPQFANKNSVEVIDSSTKEVVKTIDGVYEVTEDG